MCRHNSDVKALTARRRCGACGAHTERAHWWRELTLFPGHAHEVLLREVHARHADGVRRHHDLPQTPEAALDRQLLVTRRVRLRGEKRQGHVGYVGVELTRDVGVVLRVRAGLRDVLRACVTRGA